MARRAHVDSRALLPRVLICYMLHALKLEAGSDGDGGDRGLCGRLRFAERRERRRPAQPHPFLQRQRRVTASKGLRSEWPLWQQRERCSCAPRLPCRRLRCRSGSWRGRLRKRLCCGRLEVVLAGDGSSAFSRCGSRSRLRAARTRACLLCHRRSSRLRASGWRRGARRDARRGIRTGRRERGGVFH